MPSPKNVFDLYTDEERDTIVERLAPYPFLLDEGRRLAGERVWARHVKSVLERIELARLAERINPEDFPGDERFENALAEGRTRGILVLTRTSSAASPFLQGGVRRDIRTAK